MQTPTVSASRLLRYFSLALAALCETESTIPPPVYDGIMENSPGLTDDQAEKNGKSVLQSQLFSGFLSSAVRLWSVLPSGLS